MKNMCFQGYKKPKAYIAAQGIAEYSNFEPCWLIIQCCCLQLSLIDFLLLLHLSMSNVDFGNH